jgi:hypothetical protein
MHHRYSHSNTQQPDTGMIVTTIHQLVELKMENLFKGYSLVTRRAWIQGPAAGSEVCTCLERPALLQADAHTERMPLLSSIYLRVEHTVVAPRLI